MNKNGKLEVGMVFVLVFFILLIVAFSTIEPLKESLDNNRGNSTTMNGLNCPGTPTFDQDNYDDDSTLEKLTRRPTCFVTGMSMVWFIGVVIFAGLTWVVRNWRKK